MAEGISVIKEVETGRTPETHQFRSTTHELIAPGKNINPFEDSLRSKGLSFDIPDRFTDTSRFPSQAEGTHIDPLTGLPIEEDGLRIQIAKEFTDAIFMDQNWAMIYADVDNLKVANTKLGRDFGDMVIRHGAAKITRTVDSLNIPEDVTIYATRQTGAADETVLWILNPTEEQLNQLQSAMKKIGDKETITNPDFTFSTSAVLVTNKDHAVQDHLQQARELVKADPRAIAFDTFNAVKAYGDDNVKIEKIAKDLARIPQEQLTTTEGLQERKNILLKELGDTRVSTPLLQRAFDLIQLFTVLEMKKTAGNDEAFQSLLATAGLDIETIGTTTDKELLENAFRKILGSTQS